MAYKIIERNLKEVINEIIKLNKHNKNNLYVRFHKKFERKLWFILLYFSQIELAKNIQNAFINRNPISIPILVRSSLDLLIQMKMCNDDFKSLISNFKGNIKNDFEHFTKELRSIKLNKLSKNELSSIYNILQSDPSNNAELSKFIPKKLKEFEKRGIAKLEKELEYSYKILSSHVHNDYGALVDRHGKKINGLFLASTTKSIDKWIIYFSIYTLMLILQLTVVELIKCIGLPNNYGPKEIYTSIKKCLKTTQKYL